MGNAPGGSLARPKWTYAEERLLEVLVKEGRKTREIAERIGRSLSSVRTKKSFLVRGNRNPSAFPRPRSDLDGPAEVAEHRKWVKETAASCDALGQALLAAGYPMGVAKPEYAPTAKRYTPVSFVPGASSLE